VNEEDLRMNEHHEFGHWQPEPGRPTKSDFQRFSDGRSAMGQAHVLPHRAAGIIGAAIVAGLAGATGLVLTWIDRYRQRRMLSSLSDHMLKDIGVTRADVDREAGKRFWHG
jgi:uncharacterized protein YjiS (DUF1127 family)